MGGGAHPPPGRQASLTRAQRQAIIDMHAAGTKPRVIAARLGCDYTAARNIIQRHKAAPIQAAPPVSAEALVAAVDAGRVPVLPKPLLRDEGKQVAAAMAHLIERDSITPMQAAAKLGLRRPRARKIVASDPRLAALAAGAREPRAPSVPKGPSQRAMRQAAAAPAIRRMVAERASIREIAEALRMAARTVRKVIAANGITRAARAKPQRSPAQSTEDRPGRLPAVGRYAKPTTRHPPAALPRPEPIAAPLPPADQAAVADAAVARRYETAKRMIASAKAPFVIAATCRLPLREVIRLQRAAA